MGEPSNELNQNADQPNNVSLLVMICIWSAASDKAKFTRPLKSLTLVFEQIRNNKVTGKQAADYDKYFSKIKIHFVA